MSAFFITISTPSSANITKSTRAASPTFPNLPSVQRVFVSLDLLQSSLRCNKVPPEGDAGLSGYSRWEFKVATGRGHTVPMVTQVGQDGCRLSILKMRQRFTPIPCLLPPFQLHSAKKYVSCRCRVVVDAIERREGIRHSTRRVSAGLAGLIRSLLSGEGHERGRSGEGEL